MGRVEDFLTEFANHYSRRAAGNFWGGGAQIRPREIPLAPRTSQRHEMPIQMANKYKLTINFKVAKALGIDVLSADEVIE